MFLKRFLPVICLFSSFAFSQTGVLTRGYDNYRSGTNSHETILNQANIAAKGLVRQTIIPVVGDARGMEAQPLILPHVSMKDGSVHDVMVLPSMADVVRGVDAETGAGLWQTTLGTPVLETPNPNIDMYSINQHWGCLSTGVISNGVWYGACQYSPDNSGKVATSRYAIYGLNISDGSQAFTPVTLTGNMILADGKSAGDFNSTWKKLRSSAAIYTYNGHPVMIQGFGNVYMTQKGVSGGIFAFDTVTHKVTSIFATSNGLAANIWNSGSGVSIDSKGNIFALTATGYFDGVEDFAECALRLTYDGTLHLVDWWSPYLDMQRTGQTPLPKDLIAGANPATNSLSMPVNGMDNQPLSFKGARVKATVNPMGQVVTLVSPAIPAGDWADQDFGSDQMALIEPLGVAVASDKDGIAYSIKSMDMGKSSLSDMQNPAKNYAKLAAPCFWLTVYPGTSCSPQNPQDLNFLPNGATAHLHATPVQYYDPILKSWTLFVWGENQNLRKVSVDTTGQLNYIAESHEFASNNVRNVPGGGMTGGFCSLSSNGADPNSAIIVCTTPYGDANKTVTNGRLLVYDPVHLASDGSLKVLWDSERWGISFVFNKFDPPVIYNGHVYVSNYNGGVDLYTLGK